MKTALCIIWMIGAVCATASAGPRTSANYSIPAESIGEGGARAQSASYALNGSALGEAGAGGSAIATSAAFVPTLRLASV